MPLEPPNAKEEHSESGFIPYQPKILSALERLRRVQDFRASMALRRSVRDFSDEPFDIELIRTAIAAASSAPSGANKQPWRFCVVGNADLKREIRKLAEQEERMSYDGRMSQQWLADLAPLGTNAVKSFLERAPYLIVVFKRPFEMLNGEQLQNYYVNESVGIAVGLLLSALHQAGLSTLTHTPSPMNFLGKILKREKNERPYLLIPVGLAHPDAKVPNIFRRPLSEVLTEYL